MSVHWWWLEFERFLIENQIIMETNNQELSDYVMEKRVATLKSVDQNRCAKQALRRNGCSLNILDPPEICISCFVRSGTFALRMRIPWVGLRWITWRPIRIYTRKYMETMNKLGEFRKNVWVPELDRVHQTGALFMKSKWWNICE